MRISFFAQTSDVNRETQPPMVSLCKCAQKKSSEGVIAMASGPRKGDRDF